MNLGAIFIGVALLVLVVPYVIDPFRSRGRQVIAQARGSDAEVDRSPNEALFALRDLEFDYQTEKITEADYRSIRAKLLAQAADSIETRQQENDHLEALIQARRTNKPTHPDCPQCGKVFREGDKFCPGCGQARATQCPDCGHQNRADDEFCSQCGQSLEVQT